MLISEVDAEIPTRSEISIIPDVPNGIPGQQHTYMLILRASFSNTWADLTKVFNAGWNRRDRVIDLDGKLCEGDRPYPKIKKDGEDGFRHIWLHQIEYSKAEDGMRARLKELQSRQDFVIRSFDKDRKKVIDRTGNFADVMQVIELWAGEAGVELVMKASGNDR